MKVTVENPTSTAKAIRVPGGLPVIAPGKKLDAVVDWSDAERERYEAAGLVVKVVKPEPQAKPGRAKKEGGAE